MQSFKINKNAQVQLDQFSVVFQPFLVTLKEREKVRKKKEEKKVHWKEISLLNETGFSNTTYD